ncbi:MAG: hypothetical protein HY328_13125, partial [Chloroflexi bacterium]|nr:hypothetical protein [Chloroflexota bacterium]
ALHRWLPSQVASLGWGTTLILVTPQLSEPLLWSLHSFNRKGLNVQVVVCVRQPAFERTRQQAEVMGIGVHQALWESDLAQLGQGFDPAQPKRFDPAQPKRGGFNGV